MVEAHLVPSIALIYQPALREKLCLFAGQFFLEYQWSPDLKACYFWGKGESRDTWVYPKQCAHGIHCVL